MEEDSMKRQIAILLVLVLTLAFAACGQKKQNQPQNEDTSASLEKKACFITAYARGNDFIDMIWKGFTQLESDGWTVQCIEALDAVEYEEDIRAIAGEGYSLIMLFGGELINVGVDLSQELKDINPSLHLVMIDTELDFQKGNITSVSVDPFESSFVAGYVAAMTTETGTVGIIMHHDTPVMLRFSEGYYAGIKYANNGTQVVTAITGDAEDVTLAYEAALTMIASHPVDIIYQVCYTAGTGVINACAEKGIRAIGVDDWQGYINDCVFWSALKPMDIAVSGVAKMYEAGEYLPSRLNYSIAYGSQAFDNRDFEKLHEGLQNNVAKLVDGIKDGTVDVYADYADARLGY
jgi:basic membrane protein A